MRDIGVHTEGTGHGKRAAYRALCVWARGCGSIGYWLLWELTHSPFWLGYAVFAHWFPFIIFSLHSGAWADRFDNRRLLQVSQACSLLLRHARPARRHWLPAALAHDRHPARPRLLGRHQLPSSQVLIYDLVGKDSLPNALSLSAAAERGAVPRADARTGC